MDFFPVATERMQIHSGTLVHKFDVFDCRHGNHAILDDMDINCHHNGFRSIRECLCILQHR